MKNKGFTILEILVVLSVIAVLIGIAIPKFKGMQDEANLSRAKAELKSVQAAIESYYINSNPHAYPPDNVSLGSSLSAAPVLILSSVPYDPVGATATSAIRYIRSTGNGRFWYAASTGLNSAFEATTIHDSTGVISFSGTPANSDDIIVTNGTDPR